MSEILFIAISILVLYNIFNIAIAAFKDMKLRKNHVYDDRDTDEKRIAGEDTSEVALDYLKKL